MALAVTLPANFNACERGNVLLIAEDGDMNSWIRIDGDKRLEISLRAANYPSLTVATVSLTDKELLAHILDKCQGMHIRKLNLDVGDELPSGMVPYKD